ncbi:MAG: vitamin B12 dependent-methionine synthase activation domain-containing protein [Candidatus Eremiobacteraeota bacterium]|nr:vitamin B12 dependent-methionine synthase activation domain-containing protein [Candidatus Eremiobacteraeota bacterium]
MTDVALYEEFLEDFPIELRERSVLRYMGYPSAESTMKSPFASRIRGMLGEMIAGAPRLFTPKGIFCTAPLTVEGDSLFLCGASFTSAFLARRFRGASLAGLFAVTIGSGLERELKGLFEKGRMSEALILDSIGSEAAEQAARFVHRRIEKHLGMRLVRYSPGYNDRKTGFDWDIREQAMLFRLLAPERVGITLSRTSMMEPRKSVTAIIGPGF